MRSGWPVFAAAAAALLPAVAAAQSPPQALRWNDPESFRRAMVDAGYEADLFSSDQGTSRINAHIRGATGSFNIDFLPCEGDDRDDQCRAAYFSLPYVLDGVPAVRAAWNRSRGRPEDHAVAYGEDGYTDPVRIDMEMEVEIPAAGLPRGDFLAKLHSWQAMADVFEAMMRRTPGADRPMRR